MSASLVVTYPIRCDCPRHTDDPPWQCAWEEDLKLLGDSAGWSFWDAATDSWHVVADTSQEYPVTVCADCFHNCFREGELSFGDL
jgi:hypothetical protein